MLDAAEAYHREVSRAAGRAPEAVRELLPRLRDPAFTKVRAADAIARLRAGEQFDRILCDLMMPQMSGIEFFEAIRSSPPQLAERVVFMTGAAVSGTGATLLALAQNPTLSKPFEPAELRAIVADS